MQLSQVLSDRGKEVINGKVLKRGSQIWMDIEVLIKVSYRHSAKFSHELSPDTVREKSEINGGVWLRMCALGV